MPRSAAPGSKKDTSMSPSSPQAASLALRVRPLGPHRCDATDAGTEQAQAVKAHDCVVLPQEQLAAPCLGAVVHFDLRAVSVHLGPSADRGHYVSIAFSNVHHVWVVVDDSNVKPMAGLSLLAVLRHVVDANPPSYARPYIFFYRRSQPAEAGVRSPPSAENLLSLRDWDQPSPGVENPGQNLPLLRDRYQPPPRDALDDPQTSSSGSAESTSQSKNSEPPSSQHILYHFCSAHGF